MAVCIFGTRWTVEFQFEHHAIDSRLDYSFYTVIAVVPLDYIAGILVIIDLQTSKILLENKFYIPKKASDGDSDDEEQDYADSMVVGSSHKRVHLWDKPDPQSVQNLTMKKNPVSFTKDPVSFPKDPREEDHPSWSLACNTPSAAPPRQWNLSCVSCQICSFSMAILHLFTHLSLYHFQLIYME